MRVALLALTLAVLAGVAGTASAHYLVEQDTPAGKICALNEEIILGAVREGDPAAAVPGVVTTDCD
jgi:hypothetical protein